MKRILGLCCLLLSIGAAPSPVLAAAGFDSIVLEPAEPSSLDPVRIVVEGSWTCPSLSSPEVVGRLVVLSFAECGSLAPPTHHVLARFAPPLDPGSYTLVILDDFDGALLHQQPFEVTDAGTPPPPEGEFLTSEEVPGFRFKVRITDQGGGSRPGTFEEDCLPETVCASGALPGRSEVLLRVVGPKPNGYLWPTFVRFTTSMVEVWVERTATGEVRYYRLAPTVPGGDELEAGFDRFGFEG
jgi:hypothetical protein